MSGTFPTTNFKSIKWQSNNNIITSETLTNKVFTKDLGGQYFSFTLSSVPLQRSEFGTINAFITKQRGTFDTFTIVPPVIGTTQGTFDNSGGSNLQVDASANIGDSVITVIPTGGGTLKAGDIIKFSNHDKVYMLAADVTLVNAVQNTIEIFPNLLTAQTTSQTVLTQDVPVKVRLDNDVQEYKTAVDGVYEYEIDVVETL